MSDDRFICDVEICIILDLWINTCVEANVSVGQSQLVGIFDMIKSNF